MSKQVIAGLSQVLASNYVLYTKTQNYHWNVTGSMFGELHSFFGSMYSDLAGATDALAEFIRALGSPAPGTLAEFLKQSKIKEASATKANQMISDLADDQERMVSLFTQLEDLALKNKNIDVANFCADRVAVHNKNKWMLKAYLEK